MDETRPLLAESDGDTPDSLRKSSLGSFTSLSSLSNTTPGSSIYHFLNDNGPDPRAWRQPYKHFIVFLLAFMAFTTSFTCISVVPMASTIVSHLDGQSGTQSNSAASVLLVTIWELGEAAGPLVIAPLSEVYGRYPVYNAANGLFILSAALSAASPSTALLVFARFLNGVAVASNVLNPAIIGDMFPAAQRGSAMSLIMLAPLLGGAIGPAIAGLIAQAAGWRQVLWISVAVAALAELLFLTCLRETYVLPRPHNSHLRFAQDDEHLHDEHLPAEMGGTLDDKQPEQRASMCNVWTAIARPARVFWSSFVLQAMSLYGAVVFAFYYVMSTTLPDILRDQYQLPPAVVGSSFLAFSAGSVIAIIVCNLTLDRIYVSFSRGQDEPHPEARLPLSITGAITLPLTLVLYGFAASYRWHVAFFLLSVVLFGFTIILAIIPVTAYVVDAFGSYSASAMTAVLITRCLMSTFLPLVTAPLAGRLGYGFGMLIVAAFCAALAPIPGLIMKYGADWRQKCSYTCDTT